jgi:hypothetical protein
MIEKSPYICKIVNNSEVKETKIEFLNVSIKELEIYLGI